jgi:hypothetical protein
MFHPPAVVHAISNYLAGCGLVPGLGALPLSLAILSSPFLFLKFTYW